MSTLPHRRPAQPAFRRSAPHTFTPLAPAHSGWDARLVNGSASAGLMAHVACGLMPEGAGWLPGRVTADLLRPVPFAPLEARACWAREGGRLRVVDVALRHDDTLVARASFSFLRGVSLPAYGALAPPTPPAALVESKLLPDFDRPRPTPPFQHYCDVRWTEDAAPTAWVRPPDALVDGEASAPLARCVAVADLLAGVIVTHQTRRGDGYKTAINADLQLTFVGAPQGDWFGLRLDRVAAEAGVGMASADLFDGAGYRGRVTQTRVSNVAPPEVMRGEPER